MITYKTINQICNEYSVSRKTVERWMKSGLPYIKLNDNNGSVRINEEDLKQMIDQKNNNKRLAERIYWLEYQLKLIINNDLMKNNEKHPNRIVDLKSLISFYPHDFVLGIDDKEILIHISCIDTNTLKSISECDLEKRFKKTFPEKTEKLRLIRIFLNVNNDLLSNQSHFNSEKIINLITINAQNISDFDIMYYLNQY